MTALWHQVVTTPGRARDYGRLAELAGYPVAWKCRDPDSGLWALDVFCTEAELDAIEDIVFAALDR